MKSASSSFAPTRQAIRLAWLLGWCLCCVALLGSGCRKEGEITLGMATAAGDGWGKVSSLSFHFAGSGLLETPKPFEVSAADGTAVIPSLAINEKATEPYFDTSVYGLDDAGKVVAFGAIRLPLVSKPFEYTLFFSQTESFSFLSRLDSTSKNLMSASVMGHQVVPLKDGRILIIGGATKVTESKGLIGVPQYTNMVRNAILYDPTTGIFENGPSLGIPRAFHTATVLQDGRVLIAGGFGFISKSGSQRLESLRSIEIFDPADDGLTVAPVNLAKARAFHTATLLPDGDVLFIGGLGKPIHNVTPITERSAQQVREIELYQKDGKGTAIEAGKFSLPVGRFLHKAALVADDRIVIVGGMSIDSSGERELKTESLLVRRAGETKWNWSAIKSTSVKPRYDHSISRVDIDGKIYAVAFGGRGSNHRPEAAIELYIPTVSGVTVSPAGSLKTPRYGHASVFMKNQNIVVLGGLNATNEPVKEAEVYTVKISGSNASLAIQNVTPSLQAPQGRYKPFALTMPFDARVYVFGGGTNSGQGPNGADDVLFQGSNTVELYTPLLSPPAADGQ